MLRDYKEEDKKIIHSITFNNVEEVLKYIEETPVNTSFWGTNNEVLLSCNPNRYEVCQTKNLDEAIKWCRQGNFEAKKDILKIWQVVKKDKQVDIIGVNEEDILISRCRDLGIIGTDIYKDVQNFIKNINLSKYLDVVVTLSLMKNQKHLY